MTRALPRLATVAVAAATARAGYAATVESPPGGGERWRRANHRGEPVTLWEGPAAAAGVVAGALVGPGIGGRVRAAGALAASTAGVVGAYDDLTGTTHAKGLRGHLGALGRGQVTSGAVKVAGIGAGGLLAATVLRRGLADRALAAVVIAGTANLVNLLDLRPGRAAKATVLASGATAFGTGAGAALAAAPLGASLGVLDVDLAERAMLGDCGANALGAALGVAVAADLRRGPLAVVAALLVAATLASERVSFTSVIESTPGLAQLDALGRRPST